MKGERFSKTSLRVELTRQIDVLEKRWGFDPSNGTAQLRVTRGSRNEDFDAIWYGEIEKTVDYGRWMHAKYMLDQIGRK